MKKLLFLALVFMSSLSHADEGCLFPPCPPPPTDAELKEANKVFTKTKYILGATFDVHDINAKSIPEFVSKTKRIKNDLNILKNEAKKLNLQAGRGMLTNAVGTIELCISYNKSAVEYCHQALTVLKDYFWSKHFGTTWSGYPVMKEWNGFPEKIK